MDPYLKQRSSSTAPNGRSTQRSVVRRGRAQLEASAARPRCRARVASTARPSSSGCPARASLDESSGSRRQQGLERGARQPGSGREGPPKGLGSAGPSGANPERTIPGAPWLAWRRAWKRTGLLLRSFTRTPLRKRDCFLLQKTSVEPDTSHQTTNKRTCLKSSTSI